MRERMFLEHHVRLEAMGLIDLDVSFFIQLGVFLVFLVVMNTLLFKPLLRVFDERKKRTEGARDDASRDDARAREMIADYEAKLSSAVNEGAALRAKLRAEAVAQAQAHSTEARERYGRRVSDGSRKAREEYDASRGDVAPAARPLAEAIARKVLGTSSTK